MSKPMVLFRMAPYLIISGMLLQSCEDVIRVDLKNTSPQLVVEANISNLSDSVVVKLHKSTDYFVPAGIAPVTNASVTILDLNGNNNLLTNMGNGIYYLDNYHAMPGDTFQLFITVDDKQYTASSAMPEPVPIDSLTVRERPGDPEESQILVYFRDPEGMDNYYQVKIYKNDSLLNGGNHYVLYSDKYFEGTSAPIIINSRRFGGIHFLVSDTVKVQLISLDKDMYDYYQVLRDITEGEANLSASTPSNPPNNISNGALGYFSAWSLSQMTTVVE